MLVLLAATLLPETVQVTPPSFTEAREPQLAIDGDHSVYVAYGMGDAIYLSVSQDQGSTFGQPVKVAEAGKMSLGMRRGPRIAVHQGVVTITATYGRQGGGKDGDLLAFRSADNGKDWGAPVPVNDVEGADREGLHAMAAAPDGTLACTWLDLRTKGTKLYLATSRDGGATWSKNRLVYASPSGTVCQCCHPSLAFDAKGKLYVMFRNALDGARDLYLTSSADLGQTFTSASKLGEGTWMLNACPMDGGSLTVNSSGEVEAVWRRENTLYRSGATGPESVLGEGTQGWTASGPDGVYMAWTNGSRVLACAPTARRFQLTANGNDPVLASSPDASLVLAAWTEGGIRVARLK